MAQTTADAQPNPFEQIHLLNDDRTQFFLRTAESLAERLEETLSRWLSDLTITPGPPDEIQLPDLIGEANDVALVTADYHLGSGLVITDLPLALALITTMCGGHPLPAPDIRPLTRLEIGVYNLILTPVVQMAAETFMMGPATVGLHVSGASGLPDAKMEPGVAVPLDVKMGDITGRITLGLTATHLQTYLEELDRMNAGRLAKKKDARNEQLVTSVRAVPMELIVGFDTVKVPAGVLADLQVGDVLRTGQMLSQSLVARVGAERLFSVRAAQQGQRLVAEVTGRIASDEGVQ
ncbi:MAG: FliM/FliN family flagellar motor switch protein [Actinomycetota bacterium]